MESVGQKIRAIAGLAHTQDVDQKTSDFIDNVVARSNNGKQTSVLSEGQVEWIEDIHRKHIGGS